MKLILTTVLMSFMCFYSRADSLSIKVHFLYGSKPKKEYRDTENKWFGGIHGGHVSIEIGEKVYGFVPSGGFHVFPQRDNRNSAFVWEELEDWKRDSINMKYTSFIIPVDSVLYDELLQYNTHYCAKTPYDYAFFGMRCAAATGDILGHFGFLRNRGKAGNTSRFFYPKRLRKKMYKLAEEKNWQIVSHQGNHKRKWEKD